jgi:type II secretory pathway pseudopilin PulG
MIAKAGAPDPALVVAIVAAVFAALAAVFAGWSAWSSHRSAGSSASSARSAAEAVELERDRRHRELTPRMEVTHDGYLGGWGDSEQIWFTNKGPLNYSSVVVSFAELAEDSPIAGFLGKDVATEDDVGPLAVGERNFLIPRRHGEDEGTGTLYLTLTCSNDQGTWTIPAQVEIPGVPKVY